MLFFFAEVLSATQTEFTHEPVMLNIIERLDLEIHRIRNPISDEMVISF